MLIQTMRGEMRVLHYAMATEKAYVRWVKRFSGHVGSTALEQFDEMDVGTCLTSLAVEGNVSASTQIQAQSALLFFYQCVIHCVTVLRPVWSNRERTFKRFKG
ncbi:MAG: site-specific integrase [Planctomycetota bacterium]